MSTSLSKKLKTLKCSVILLAANSASPTALLKWKPCFANTTGNHSVSGAFPVRMVIRGTLQTAAQIVSQLPNHSMEKDPGDFRDWAVVSYRGCKFKA